MQVVAGCRPWVSSYYGFRKKPPMWLRAKERYAEAWRGEMLTRLFGGW
jgi:hypothetical protein